MGEFHFATDCLFCGNTVKFVGKRKSCDEVFRVRTIEFKDTVLSTCQERSDEWAATVQSRILNVHDLHAADSLYHQVCSINFRTGKQIPSIHQIREFKSKRPKLGRPQDDVRYNAFLKVVNFLVENDDQVTINDLISLMEKNLQGSGFHGYGYKHLKQKLKEHFANRMILTEIKGKESVVTLITSTQAILHDFYSLKKADHRTEKIRFIETAAKLLMEDIKEVQIYHDVYPCSETFKCEDECMNFLPESLRLF